MPVIYLGPATGEAHFEGSYEEYVTRGLLATIARRARRILPPLTEVSPLPPLPAWLYNDRWIAECPEGHNRQLVFEATPLYMCCECWNVGAGGLYREVAFPAERADIEAAIAVRPMPVNRNWLPSETVADLLAENAARGGG